MQAIFFSRATFTYGRRSTSCSVLVSRICILVFNSDLCGNIAWIYGSSFSSISIKLGFLREFLLSRRGSILLGLWGIFNDTHGNSLSVVSLGFLLSGLDSSGFSLFLELGLSDFLLLHLVDALDQNGFVLELVTLGAEVEMMVDVLGDLLGFSVLLEKSSEDSLSSHPEDLRRHSGVGGTLSLTETVVSS